MLNDQKRELCALLGRIVSSRALMDVPAIVAEARDQAAALKGAERKQLASYLDAIARAETNKEASVSAADAISLLETESAEAEAEPIEAAAKSRNPAATEPANERARPARKRAPAEARRSAPSRRARGRK